MKPVALTNLRVAMASASNCGGFATEMMTVVMTAMKPSAQLLLVNQTHTSPALTVTAYRPGGGATVLKTVRMELMK